MRVARDILRRGNRGSEPIAILRKRRLPRKRKRQSRSPPEALRQTLAGEAPRIETSRERDKPIIRQSAKC
jgi:hypothetical protein